MIVVALILILLVLGLLGGSYYYFSRKYRFIGCYDDKISDRILPTQYKVGMDSNGRVLISDGIKAMQKLKPKYYLIEYPDSTKTRAQFYYGDGMTSAKKAAAGSCDKDSKGLMIGAPGVGAVYERDI